MLVGPENHVHMKGVAKAVNRGLVKFPSHNWVYVCHDKKTTQALLRMLGPAQFDVVVEPEVDRAHASEILEHLHRDSDSVIAVRGSKGGDYGKNRVLYLPHSREIQTPDGFQFHILSPITRARDSPTSRFY